MYKGYVNVYQLKNFKIFPNTFVLLFGKLLNYRTRKQILLNLNKFIKFK